MQFIHYVITSFLLLFKYEFENLVVEIYWGACTKENNESLGRKWVYKAQKGTKFVFLGFHKMTVILETSR